MVQGGSLRAGMRVLIHRDVDLRPHTTLRKGERGTVRYTEADALGVYAVNVHMDKPHEGLRQWGNCAYLVAPEIDAVGAVKAPAVAKRASVLMAGVGGAAIALWPKAVVSSTALAPALKAAGVFAVNWIGLGALMVM